ncbi:CocE/NonD family hydrolase [Paenibacillus oralis]|uniref:CocE/NonD family hydrolase n=1 Tax=Paenibacillus oralis TaxID=2490856 RepID=A0A3P3U3D2_9BACL|nr:CocE/NonD family hydrolase [Paenibacillus oralis]RRJ64634.1 CocE/NonD family hydrolase [Paenibacillus oralis]
MKNKLKRIISVFVCFVLILSITACSSSNTTKEKVSKPFVYSGYTKAEFKDYKKSSQYVEMSDGTKLAVDIYLPTNGPEQAAFPVVFQYTPYGRAFIMPDVKWYEKPFIKNSVGTWGPVLDRANSFGTVYGSTDKMVNLFLSHGYAYVCADMRGTGASYGTKIDFSPKLAEDGFELVNWIEDQVWSDGSVGMFGGSYLGYSQIITAGQTPKALKAIFPEVFPMDGFTGEIRPGGIFLWAYSQLDMQSYLEHNYYLPDEGYYPTAPVVDEDGDGKLDDEIPLDLNGNGTFLDDYSYPGNPNDPPQYADGEKREHLYYLGVYEHLENTPYSDLGPKTAFIDDEWEYTDGGKTKTVSAYSVGPSSALAAIMESGVPVYNHGGWMDPFVRGTTELYSTLKDTNPSKLVIDAGYHEGTSPYWEYFGEDEEEVLAKYGVEMLRFFDRYLKGIENGIDTEPPVYIYNMNGDGWRAENEWPLARQEMKSYYFAENGTLDTIIAAAGTDLYTVNYKHDARWGKSYRTSRWQMASPDELPVRTELDKMSLTYTTAPMTQDTEVTGHPVVDFWVSSTADNGDFFIYLEDVDENGKAVLVTEGLLRAGFNGLYDNDTMIQGREKGIDVKPELPWHGYEKSQYNDAVFANGSIVQLTVDLLPTSWVFKEGHSIRVSIACADWPTFEILPELSPTNNPDDPDNIVPVITVHRDGEHPSHLMLPVIPR